MATVPVSHFPVQTGSNQFRVLSRTFKGVVSAFQLFAAAIRVSRAVEARKDPLDADLQTLGVQGKLPKTW